VLEEALLGLFDKTSARCKNTLALRYLDMVKAQCLNYLSRRTDFK